MSDTEFIKCTLAQGHFSNLNTGLNHTDSNPMCLTARFLKDNNKIQNQCKFAVPNITGPQTNSSPLILESGKHLIYLKLNHLILRKKVTPAPANPIDQLRTQIESFRQIETNKSSWIYCVGGGISFWFYIAYCNVLFSVMEMLASPK